jgi:hypothetical protein
MRPSQTLASQEWAKLLDAIRIAEKVEARVGQAKNFIHGVKCFFGNPVRKGTDHLITSYGSIFCFHATIALISAEQPCRCQLLCKSEIPNNYLLRSSFVTYIDPGELGYVAKYFIRI